MTASKLAPETIETWTVGLTELLEGLDLFDTDDRVTFRGRVFDATECTAVSRVRELAAHFGRPVAGNSTRSEAARALADTWIDRGQQAAVGRLGLTPTQHATLAWYAGRQAYVAGGRVVEARGTLTFGRLVGHGLLERLPSDEVRVTDRGRAWLNAAGTVAEWRGSRA